jgi:hypothetical protein
MISLPPIRRGFAPGFVSYKNGCTRLAAASDKSYQLLVHEGGRPGRPAQIVMHTCIGNLGIVKILRYIRSDMYTEKINRNIFFGRRGPVLEYT